MGWCVVTGCVQLLLRNSDSRSEPPCQTALTPPRIPRQAATEEEEAEGGWSTVNSTMLSVVSSYIWGEEEEKEENASSREEDWVLVEKPEEEEKQFFVSSVAHSVPLTVPCSGLSSLSHTLTTSPVNIGASFLVHQTAAPSSKAVTTSTQTYKPRLAAFVPLFGRPANVKKQKEKEDNDEVVVLAHYCNGQEIKIENESYRPRSKALVPLFGNMDRGLKGQKEEEVVVLADYCNWRGERIKQEREEETSKKPTDDNLGEERNNNEEEDEDVVLLAHYYNGQYIKQEEAEGRRSINAAANEKNEQTDNEVVVLSHYYNGQRIKEEIEEIQSYKPRHKALVPLFGGGCTRISSGEKRKRDDEVVVLAHYYNGQQIKQEEVDFQIFTSRNEALDFPSEDSVEGEDDEVVVVAHYYNGHQMAPLFEEEKEDEVVVLAHYQNGCQVEPSHPAFAPFIGPLEEEKDEEVVVLAHYYNGQQIKQERQCHETFQPFIGPLQEGESQRFENLIPSFENLSDPKYQDEEVEDDKEDVVVLAHYHKGQRIDRTAQPWSPARALKFSGKPLALTGPSKLALTYQVLISITWETS